MGRLMPWSSRPAFFRNHHLRSSSMVRKLSTWRIRKVITSTGMSRSSISHLETIQWWTPAHSNLEVTRAIFKSLSSLLFKSHLGSLKVKAIEIQVPPFPFENYRISSTSEMNKGLHLQTNKCSAKLLPVDLALNLFPQFRNKLTLIKIITRNSFLKSSTKCWVKIKGREVL